MALLLGPREHPSCLAITGGTQFLCQPQLLPKSSNRVRWLRGPYAALKGSCGRDRLGPIAGNVCQCLVVRGERTRRQAEL